MGINGVLISDSIHEKNDIVPPRPVFHEELDLLGFKEKFNYSDSKAPLLWAIDRRYYYMGQLVAEVRGGSIYKDPQVSFAEDFKLKSFEPIDVNTMIQRNMKSISALENEAMDFARDAFSKYKNKVDGFVVAFSGGKDSQVILDIVSRVIPPKEYKVIFTDTGMELPLTYETVEQTRKVYSKKYNDFELVKAESDKTAISLWKKYGPPSRINRWCCSVLKTALFGRKMRDLLSVKGQPRLVVYEGVRADESNKRETYNRIGEGVKHINLTNCRPIFKWNTTEIFLYLFYREIEINAAYRLGFNRVGCSVCPFASDWSEFLIRKHYEDIAKSYVDVIARMAKNMGIVSETKIQNYIDVGNWKKNAGGKGLEVDGSRIDVLTKEPNFEAVITQPKTEFLTWLQIVGDFMLNKKDENTYLGELNYNDEVYRFELQTVDSQKAVFKVFNTTNKILLVSALNKILNKTAYCEKCGVCEMECPTGALRILPNHQVEVSACARCRNCLNVASKGCIIAERRKFTEGETKVSLKSSSIDKYSTFGLRELWLTNFFEEMDNWFLNNGGLGSKQVPAMISWLRESELLEAKEKKTTELAKILKGIFYKNPLLVWQIVWVNLAFNSTIVKWYVEKVQNEIAYSKPELLIQLKEDYPNFKEGTLDNPLSALFNTFENSPLGSSLEIGVIQKRGNIRSVVKIGGNFISSATIAYLIYKFARQRNCFELTVSDLYNEAGNPSKLLGVSTDYFLNCLRSLQEEGKDIVKVDLLGGLDNIHLCEDYDELAILRMLI